MGRELRRASPNQDQVAAVVAVVVAVVAESMLEMVGNLLEKVGKFHYPMTSAGDVVKEDTRRDTLAKLWKQFVEVVEQRGTMKNCV